MFDTKKKEANTKMFVCLCVRSFLKELDIIFFSCLFIYLFGNKKQNETKNETKLKFKTILNKIYFNSVLPLHLTLETLWRLVDDNNDSNKL